MPATDLQEWASRLDVLLRDAVRAKQSGDVGKIVGATKALSAFRADSPPTAEALDVQASLAIFDLDLAEKEDAVANIQARSEEVRRLTKMIAAVAAEANHAATGLRGEPALAAIGAATSAIASFRKLRDQLDVAKPDEKVIAQEIETVLAAVQALRSRIEVA